MSQTDAETLSLIEGLLKENRTFPPPDEFRRTAIIQDDSVYREAEADYEAFWARVAEEFVEWFRPPTKQLEWDPPHCTWFADGRAERGLQLPRQAHRRGPRRQDRLPLGRRARGRDARPDLRRPAARKSARLANGLKELGVRKGDRVGIYMGMIPELPIAMLACARIGAPHIVVFGGFSSDSLAERLARLRSEGAHHAGRGLAQGRQGAAEGRTPTPPPPTRRRSSASSSSGERAARCLSTSARPLVARARRRRSRHLRAGADECRGHAVPAPHLGLDGQAERRAAHDRRLPRSTSSVTHKWIFDIHDDSVWWCAADIGWVTGHSYIVYGPLNNGTTSVLYEGDPAYPDWDRHWEIVERYGVSSYYTAPTLIRSFVKMGEDYPGAARPLVAARRSARSASRSTPRPGSGTGR